MKKITKNVVLKKLLVGFIATTLFYIFPAFAIAADNGKQLNPSSNIPPLDRIISRDQNGNFIGFTEDGKDIIEKTRQALINRKKAAQEEFKKFESIYHAAHVIRGIKGHMFLYGPPGGSKSHFSDWFLNHENDPSFTISVHQMMTEMVFTGGQVFESTKLGTYKLNTEGSLASYKTALIDEIDKGNPATLASLLGLLNERVVRAGSDRINSPLETVFSTSNKNLYEIYEAFKNQLDGTTAEALFNRFLCIAFVPNWLDEEDQEAIDDKLIQERENRYYGNFSEEQTDESSLHLDWDNIRLLAQAFFHSTKEFNKDAKKLANSWRERHKQILGHDTNDNTVRQFSERQREKINDIIFMSLTLDLLTSSLTVKQLETTLKNTPGNRFVLSPYSLWRAYIFYTTPSFGVTKLKENKTKQEGTPDVEIDFGSFLEKYKKGAGYHDKQAAENIIAEQRDFKEILKNVWQTSEPLANRKKNDPAIKTVDATEADIIDIEALLLKLQDTVQQ